LVFQRAISAINSPSMACRGATLFKILDAGLNFSPAFQALLS
jgi:hypothetical protein